MLTAVLDAIMERRARRLLDQLRPWLPAHGSLLDLGSGTGHVSARLQREAAFDVVPADVSDIHVAGPPPRAIADGELPFAAHTFSATLLLFMLSYPDDPVRVLKEAARVTRGPIIVVQSLHSGGAGYAWLRVREFLWTWAGFHVSRIAGYVARDAGFTMRPRRFYTAAALRHHVSAAGLRIHSRWQRPAFPGGSLVVAGWLLEPDA